MSVDGLEKTECDPDVHGEDVEVLGEEAVKQRSRKRAGTENEDFSRVGIFSS